MKAEFYNELKHHGIKGQKWGVRRFQNTDGTLTSKGRKRLNEIKTSVIEKATERAKAGVSSKGDFSSKIDYKPSGVKTLRSTVEYKPSGIMYSHSRYRNPDGTLTASGRARYNENGKRKDPRDMTDEELRSANSRLQAEKQYRQLTGKVQLDQAFATDTAIKVGASVAGSVLTAALISKLDNGAVSTGKSAVSKMILAGGMAAVGSTVGSLGGSITNVGKDKKKG